MNFVISGSSPSLRPSWRTHQQDGAAGPFSTSPRRLLASPRRTRLPRGGNLDVSGVTRSGLVAPDRDGDCRGDMAGHEISLSAVSISLAAVRSISREWSRKRRPMETVKER
jgi:hypothetical protein